MTQPLTRPNRLGAASWFGATAFTVLVGALIPLLWNRRYYFADDTQAGAFGIWYALGSHLRDGVWPLFSVSSWMSGNYAAEGQWGLWNPLILGIAYLAAGAGNAAVFSTVVKIVFLVLAGVGTHVLVRSYGVRHAYAFTAGVTAPFAGFTFYMDAPSWVTGLIVWALVPWAWWAMRRAVAGANPLPVLLVCYLVVTVGYVHGTVALAATVLAVGVDVVLARSRRGMIVLVGVAAFCGLIALTVYLPGVLSADVTLRASRGVSNDGFLVGDLSGFAASGVPTAQPDMLGWWGRVSSGPLLYVSWLLPTFAFVDWRRAAVIRRELVDVLVFLCFSLAFVLGPSAFGPLRFPVRFTPYLALATVVVLAVLLDRARAHELGRARLIGALALVASGTYLAFAQVPSRWLLLGITAVILCAVIVALWLQLGGSRRLPERARRGPAIAVLVAVVTLGLVGWQHRAFYASPLPDFGLPAAVSEYRGQLSAAVNDAIIIGDSAERVDRVQLWDETLLANGWYLNPQSVQNTYTPLSYATYASRLCMDWRGNTCGTALEALLEKDGETGLLLVDELSIDTIQVIKEAVPAADWAVPPDGWSVAADLEHTVTWTRDVPLGPAGGVVWTSAGVEVTELSRTATELRVRVDEVGSQGGTLLMSRLAWPGYSVENGRVGEPMEDFLLTVDVDADSAGREVVLRFVPPGWTVEVGALVMALVGGAAWAVVAAVGRSRRGRLERERG